MSEDMLSIEIEATRAELLKLGEALIATYTPDDPNDEPSHRIYAVAESMTPDGYVGPATIWFRRSFDVEYDDGVTIVTVVTEEEMDQVEAAQAAQAQGLRLVGDGEAE